MTNEVLESIDGPKIAAKILGAMPLERRKALLDRIAKIDFKLFQSISSNLVSFDDIPELTNASIQRLIKEIHHCDLIYALKGANSSVQESFFSNMSRNKREIVQDDLATTYVEEKDIVNAKEKICTIIDELRMKGLILSKN